MARIYSWDELVKQQYATRANLNQARRKAVQILQGLHDRGWIANGTIFGSVARGDHTLGSDVDVLVIANPNYAKQVARYLSRVYYQSMKTLHVQPEIILLTTTDAKNGKHDISRFLFNHITRNSRPETTVGTPVKKLLKIPLHDARVEERRELIHLANRSMKEQISLPHQRNEDTTAYYHAVERGLDRVINRARHVVDIIGRKNIGDHKKNMVTEYIRLVGEAHPASQILSSIAAARKKYLITLTSVNRQLKRKQTRSQLQKLEALYRASLSELERAIQKSPDFYRMNEALLSSPRRMTRRLPKPTRRGLKRTKKQ